MPVLLALDQSLVCTGWAIIDAARTVLDYGTINTEKAKNKARAVHVGSDDARRVAEIASQLGDLMARPDVVVIAAELPAGARGARAAKALGMSQAAVVAVATLHLRPMAWVTAGDAKQVLTEKVNASKGEMVTAAQAILEVSRLEHRGSLHGLPGEAVADAIGVGYAALKTDIVRAALGRVAG